MTVDGVSCAALARADLPLDTVQLRRTLAGRLSLGPCLFACDTATFGLAGILARVRPLPGLLTLVLIVATYHAGRLYRPRLTLSLLDDVPSLLGRALAVAAVVVVSPLAGTDSVMRSVLPAVSLGVVLLLLTRGMTYAGIRAARRRGLVAHRTVVVGDGDVGCRLAEAMRRHPEYGLRAVGYLGPESTLPPDGVPLLGSPGELARVVRDHSVSVVVLAFTAEPARELVSSVRTCDALRCDVFWLPQLFELSAVHPQMDLLWGYPLMRRRREIFGPVGRTVKRSVDLVAAAAALLAALPVMTACAVAVRLQGGGGPVLFRQRRLGAGLRSFVLVKFRTLSGPDAAPEGVCRFLRHYSLDELPQLVNVLRGEMSLVGPRPELPVFVDAFSRRYPGYHDRHRVKTGLTGWSQIHGLRGGGSIEDRARFDNQYIENWSVWEDVKILLRTVTALLRHRGV